MMVEMSLRTVAVVRRLIAEAEMTETAKKAVMALVKSMLKFLGEVWSLEFCSV